MISALPLLASAQDLTLFQDDSITVQGQMPVRSTTPAAAAGSPTVPALVLKAIYRFGADNPQQFGRGRGGELGALFEAANNGDPAATVALQEIIGNRGRGGGGRGGGRGGRGGEASNAGGQTGFGPPD